MTVRLFADECVAGTIIERLREVGFDIVRAIDVCPTADDEEVLARAHQDQRVLVDGQTRILVSLSCAWGAPRTGS